MLGCILLCYSVNGEGLLTEELIACLFAVFQSFDQNCSFSQHGQFITDAQTETTHVNACTAAAVRKTVRCSVNDRENPRCELCNREFNSNIQALSHFQGASHNDEVIRRARSVWTTPNMQHGEQLLCT